MIKSLLIPKEEIITIPETMNCRDALSLLEDNDQRNAPVVDRTNSLFRGNIYRYHIYKYAFHHPGEDLSLIPVTRFLKNASRVVHISDSLHTLLFVLKDLPYIPVLDQQNRFIGIVEHSRFMTYLSRAWEGQSQQIIHVSLQNFDHDLIRVEKLIQRQVKFSALLTFQASPLNDLPFIIVILDAKTDPFQSNTLVANLIRKGYQARLVGNKS